MIASIVPVKRLPRYSCVFDYQVPEHLEKNIKPGQLVVIEFRQTLEFGIVQMISHKEDISFNYKPIDSIVHEVPLISTHTQNLLFTLSQQYATSLSTLYKTSLLPLQKRKLSKMVLTDVSDTYDKKNTFSESYIVYSNEIEHRLLFSPLATADTSLVLVPEVTQLEIVKKLITATYNTPIILWHSDLSPKEKFELWLKIRNNTEPLIILGTRSTLTLPFPRLDLIIMDYEHDQQYKSYDQQPKLHARDIVPLLGEKYQATCVYSSFSPSFDCYYRIVKEKLPCMIGTEKYTDGLLFPDPLVSSDQIRVIEHIPQMRDKRVCSITTEEHLLALGHEHIQDAVILVQRKGYATYVICKDCGHIERSKTSGLPMIFRKETGLLHDMYGRESRNVPLFCDKCKSTVMVLGGIGSEKIASYVTEIFTKEKITTPIFRIDDNTDDSIRAHLANDDPRVIIGTEKILPYIRKERTGLYVILDVDRYLALPEYTAFEHLVHLIDECTYQMSPNSECIVETASSEKPLFKLFSERDRVYRTELGFRQKLLYPPYQSMIKYTLSGPDQNTAARVASLFRTDLKKQLTETGISATISEIYATHPNFHKQMYWQGVLVKTTSKNIPKIAQTIHTRLPNGCIVDLNPVSVLSP